MGYRDLDAAVRSDRGLYLPPHLLYKTQDLGTDSEQMCLIQAFGTVSYLTLPWFGCAFPLAQKLI